MSAEILAPAGSMESLVAAVRCGAHAVYLGGEGFNARKHAANFDAVALREAVRYCHIRGVKVYLALNTLVFDNELPALKAMLRLACDSGVDALIVQDLAVVSLVRLHAPEMPLHASTQMSVHDAPGARALQGLGFSRVVLARELSRDEIAAIRAESDIELECFVHGALCMCVSGQCYLSAMIGGRSGNRGLCAQPCRLPFAAGGQSHALSLKDLSLIPNAAELAGLGVASLKIEGRMKRPEYVAVATTACREALAGGAPDYAALEAVFSRAGFTDGYYDGALGPAMFGTRRKEDVQAAAPVLRELAGLYKDERQSVPVDMALTLAAGRPAALWVNDADGNRVQAEGAPPQMARTAPTTPERAAQALAKTGGTPYTVRNILSQIDDGLMIPASQLNALRRQALESLTEQRGRPRPHAWTDTPDAPVALHMPAGKRQRLRARLSCAEQLTPEISALVDEITLPVWQFERLSAELLHRHRDRLLVEIPGIVFDNRQKMDEILESVYNVGIGHAVVGGLAGGEICGQYGLRPHADYGCNITNTLALASCAERRYADVTLSPELDLRRAKALRGELPRGLLAYGYLPLMVTRNCPQGGCGQCAGGYPEVIDRRGNRFFTGCDWGVPRLHNTVPLVLCDRLADLVFADFLTLYFTRESPGECAHIAALYRVGGGWEGPKTRGLLYRGVE